MLVPKQFSNVILHYESDVLLQLRTPEPGSENAPYLNHYSLWGGSGNTDETPLETATREVSEELAITNPVLTYRGKFTMPFTGDPQKTGTKPFLDKGFTHWDNHIYSAETNLNQILSQFPQHTLGAKTNEGYAQIHDVNNLPRPFMSTYDRVIQNLLLGIPYDISDII